MGQMAIGFVGFWFGYVPIIFKANTWHETIAVIGSFNFFVSAVLVHVPFILGSIYKRHVPREAPGSL